MSAAPAGRIRVLHLIHSVTHGGIESALINWLRHFDADRFDVRVACLAFDRDREKDFLRAARIAGLDVILVPWHSRKPFLKAARFLGDLVRQQQIDIIHTHAYYGDALGALTKLFARVKVIATVYIWGKYELHRQIMQAMDWTALRFVDCVTAHCEETRRLTVKLGFSSKRVRTLFTGFPDERPEPDARRRMEFRRSAGVADDEILLLNIARIHPEKAHDQLIESFKLVHDRHPNTRLWISGVGYASLQSGYEQMAERMGLGSHVEFIGFQQDLWPFLEAADMMVHPSHVEGVPVAICYGMCSALPIVVSDVGSLYEIIESGVQGIRVPENDVAGFAKAVSGLIEDPQRARSLGDAARQFITTKYSIQTAVRRVEDTYREVLAQ